MYIPFARKYRPRLFAEVTGQEIAVKILKNAVKSKKIPHAYLFTGPKGVGKTSLARILAKALNCLNPVEGEPCNSCENCISIEKGNFPDLVEMDAASNRGIDDIRAIREAVNYTPLRGGYKVYIIDEAHMLTKEAFNALLKTLEEPPPRTLFILCTTEYEKIIPTILSRCQRIPFKRVDVSSIKNFLLRICSSEGIEWEEKALELIGEASEGCLRDAASLLDQVSVYTEGKITTQAVEEFLGITRKEKVKEFLLLLLNSKVEEALRFLRNLHDSGFDLPKFWDQLESLLREVIICKSVENPEEFVEDVTLCSSFSKYPLEALLYLENVINRGKQEARTRPTLRAYELAVVKTLIVKEIIPISLLLSDKDLLSKNSLESSIFSKLSSLASKALKEAEREIKGDKTVFKVEEEIYTNFKEEFENLKKEVPFVDFEVIKKKGSTGNTMSLF